MFDLIALIAGLTLFFVLHLIPGWPSLRAYIIKKTGESIYLSSFALANIVAFILIVIGYIQIPRVDLWPALPGALYLLFIFMPFALYLNIAAYTGTKFGRFTAHPMLWGVVIWALLHLYLNNDVGSILLFGFFALFSLFKIWHINQRKEFIPTHVPWKREFLNIALTIAVSALVLVTHQWFTGKDIMPYLVIFY